MTDNIGNRKTCWLVYEDRKRDYSAAETYGDMKVVYTSIGRDFSPKGAIDYARRVLSKMKEDDYLIMAGDPTLCAICVTVVCEMFGECNVLRWDRNLLSYSAMRLNFN